MEIEFYGAAREVTGSCHIVRAAGRTILLDCGMFQGRRKESAEENLRFPFDVDEIDALVLSHAPSTTHAGCRCSSARGTRAPSGARRRHAT